MNHTVYTHIMENKLMVKIDVNAMENDRKTMEHIQLI